MKQPILLDAKNKFKGILTQMVIDADKIYDIASGRYGHGSIITMNDGMQYEVRQDPSKLMNIIAGGRSGR